MTSRAAHDAELLLQRSDAVELVQQGVHVYAVNHAGLFYRLALRGGAVKAVHTDGHEQRSGIGSDAQDIADDGILGN